MNDIQPPIAQHYILRFLLFVLAIFAISLLSFQIQVQAQDEATPTSLITPCSTTVVGCDPITATPCPSGTSSALVDDECLTVTVSPTECIGRGCSLPIGLTVTVGVTECPTDGDCGPFRTFEDYFCNTFDVSLCDQFPQDFDAYYLCDLWVTCTLGAVEDLNFNKVFTEQFYDYDMPFNQLPYYLQLELSGANLMSDEFALVADNLIDIYQFDSEVYSFFVSNWVAREYFDLSDGQILSEEQFDEFLDYLNQGLILDDSTNLFVTPQYEWQLEVFGQSDFDGTFFVQPSFDLGYSALEQSDWFDPSLYPSEIAPIFDGTFYPDFTPNLPPSDD